MANFDHVIIAVRDPEEAAARLESRYGVRTHSNVGRHPGGTANRVLPLKPPEYLELLYVTDEEALAMEDPLLHRAMSRTEQGDFLLGWMVRDVDVDAMALELGAPIGEGTAQSDQTSSAWRYVEVADGPPGFPRFIEYRNADQRLGRWQRWYEEAGHTPSPGAIEWVELTGSAATCRRIRELLPYLDTRCSVGPPALEAIGFRAGREVVRLDNDALRN